MTEAPSGAAGGAGAGGASARGGGSGAAAGSPPTLGASAPGSAPLARAVFAALVVACLAAFLITQRLKHTPTVVQELDMTPYFSPYPSGHLKQAAISFKLEHAERVTVTVIDTAGDAVATLVRNYPLPRYKTFSLTWNGRRGAALTYLYTKTPHGLPIVSPQNTGALAPAGEYRVRVQLSHHSPVYSTITITLVAP